MSGESIAMLQTERATGILPQNPRQGYTPVPATAMTKGIEKHPRRAAMRCLRYIVHMVAKDGRGLETGGHEWHVTPVVRLPAVT